MIRCHDCSTPLEWKGTGRKPKRCSPCSKKESRRKHAKVVQRDKLHAKGKAASRFGDAWLIDGKVVRREARFVWGATGDRDETVTTMSGVFHKIGRHGLPGQGFSTTLPDLQADLRRLTELARGEDTAAKAWLQDNVGWWRFEEFAHDAFSRDITDSVVVMAQSWEDSPDEAHPQQRCSFCCEHRALVLMDEFCSEECMEDYVKTFGMV